MLNSSYTAPSKICNDLFAINSSNKKIQHKTISGEDYILVLTWTKEYKWYIQGTDTNNKAYNPGSYSMWVTVAPELKEKVAGVDSSRINMRLKQLLGLQPESQYNYFVTLWVRPQDIFRPCADMEINDNSCGLAFPPNTDSSHIKWINAQRIGRFFVPDTANRYPWTELGYTYDWDPYNRKHIVCSEYIIKTNSTLYREKIYTTKEYIYGYK